MCLKSQDQYRIRRRRGRWRSMNADETDSILKCFHFSSRSLDFPACSEMLCVSLLLAYSTLAIPSVLIVSGNK